MASAADVCLKPWLHAVVLTDVADVDDQKHGSTPDLITARSIDLIVRIECRNREGDRLPEHDLELEIYRSGNDLNLMLTWCDQPDRPMLWQGQHPVWMDGTSGQRCQPPEDGAPLESFARRLRALLVLPEQS
ncbi:MULTISPECIES: hypothetical protein [unclassified Prochlorococcus]|uniref:hypothetical protein n=1 Tax=unclassified Prochlorococcus TaxID=2627481 RepID=UPI001F4D0C93|nr:MULTISPECIES: hypothetical protein [unclassified Prochlorococcus]